MAKFAFGIFQILFSYISYMILSSVGKKTSKLIISLDFLFVNYIHPVFLMYDSMEVHITLKQNVHKDRTI